MESDLLVAFKAEFDVIWPLVSLKKRPLPGVLPLDPWAYSTPQEPPAGRGLRMTLTLCGGSLTLDQIIFQIFGKLTVSSLIFLPQQFEFLVMTERNIFAYKLFCH